MANTPIDRLDAAIKKILSEYEETITMDVDAATKKVARAGAKAVSASARATFGGSGKYANGWTSETEKKRWSSTGVIYNAAAPGLAHLLENGHAKVGGGRVEGRPHIAPVEEEINKEYEEAVIRAINGY